MDMLIIALEQHQAIVVYLYMEMQSKVCKRYPVNQSGIIFLIHLTHFRPHDPLTGL